VTGQANFDCHEDELLLLLTFDSMRAARMRCSENSNCL
jgi:hypothetical protein